VGDARDPRFCKGYPHCSDCDCTKSICYKGVPLSEHLERLIIDEKTRQSAELIPTHWTGWRGKVQTEEERKRNEAHSFVS